MAIMTSQTRTGISWVRESYALFKQAPQQCSLIALAHMGLFFVLPSLPGMQLAVLMAVLVWPLMIAIIAKLYCNIEMHQRESLAVVMQALKPKVGALLFLGFVCLTYLFIISLFIGEQASVFNEMVNNQAKMTEAEMAAMMKSAASFFFKLLLMLIPLYMLMWFSPMLIVFNDYLLIKALKSSLAGVLQYMVALIAAWVLLTSIFLLFTIFSNILVGALSIIAPMVAKPLIFFLTLGGMVITAALMLAFQYVSYRDVFRAA